jgi:hypothetical protein
MRLYLAGSTCTWVALSFLEVPDYTLFRLAGDETAGGGGGGDNCLVKVATSLEGLLMKNTSRTGG